MFLLIMERGLVRTDSAVYVQEFDVIRYRGLLASAFEPGFTLLIEVLNWFLSDPFQILILLGATTAIIMFLAGLMLERSPLLMMTIVLRSEEHTSELRSLMRISYAVFCLKKKKITHNKN